MRENDSWKIRKNLHVDSAARTMSGGGKQTYFV